MNKLTLMVALLRERLSARRLPREPEPDLVMDDPDQVAAYHEAGRIDGLMSAAYLFHSARITQVIQGCRQVIDLGCGPAVQLCQIAQLNPEIEFHGIDLSATMLEQARQNVGALGLKNVHFTLGDITKLDFLQDASVDGIISTVALHHLPTHEHLRQTFHEINRVLRPDGALYLVDFGRLKLLKSVIYFAYQNAAHQPHLFTLDYERSLRAAFEFEDFQRMASIELPGRANVIGTFMVPMLVLVKTDDKPIDSGLRNRLKSAARAMPRRYQSDLNDIRKFFGMSGLKNDPF